jgi:NAD(P)-dependent dehydrogenase (short-subunit alcohol dehydrogenase family)
MCASSGAGRPSWMRPSVSSARKPLVSPEMSPTAATWIDSTRRSQKRAGAWTSFSPIAGISEIAVLDAITEQHLDLLWSVNVKGVVFTVQKALPLLNDHASVIVNSSVAADRGREGMGMYAATKAALRSFARTWANELRARNIRVNAVIPGTTDTPGLDTLATQTDPNATSEEFRAHRISGIPMGRVAEPVEVANAVLFLASDLSSFTTGAALPVDGGTNQI